MRKRVWVLVTFAVAVAAIFLLSNRLMTVSGQGRPGAGFAAVPGQKGGQDEFGPYEPVAGWPKSVSTIPGNEKWTSGAGQSVFADNPNRVFVLYRGELPNIPRPQAKVYPEAGPALSFPVQQVPWRNASVGPVSALPGALEGNDTDRGQEGVDHKWENCLVVVDANGNIIERWTQWDKTFRRPHFVAINPYDAQKNVWLVDDYRHAIFKFSPDGKQLLQTIGEVNKSGNDSGHFSRPTFLAWLPDGSMFVSDGYANTRVAKFDKDGKFLLTWGEPSTATQKSPNYFNNVHGIGVDPQTRRVFVNDRGNKRIQVFDENGKFLDQWTTGGATSDIHLIYVGSDRNVWGADRGTSKIIKWDLNGNLLYSWGSFGDAPGQMFGVHGMSTDQEGNFYVAEVGGGRAQKFRPRPGADPALMIGKPFYSAWR